VSAQGTDPQAAAAGEWLQQATLAIRARVPLDVLNDTIQPFPSFSEIHATAVKALRHEITAAQPIAVSESADTQHRRKHDHHERRPHPPRAGTARADRRSHRR
jgi:hypothetical protein